MGVHSAHRPTLKRTGFFKTQTSLQKLSLEESLSLSDILEIYTKEQTKGFLNYVGAILKKKGVIRSCVKKDIELSVEEVSCTKQSKMYRRLYKYNLLDESEIVQLLKDLAASQPQTTFEAIQKQNSRLLSILNVINIDTADAISIVARTMLEQNRENVLDYINSTAHSETLRHLVKDSEGMCSLVKYIADSLSKKIETPQCIKTVIDKVISMHISLVKIDFTLVLLNPVIQHIRPVLSEILLKFGPVVGAEMLFYGVSMRIDEIIEDSNSSGQEDGGAHGPASFQGDILDFLLSLIPYDSMIETLALSISRDYVLDRTTRQKFLRILEGKIGQCRIANINIIKGDFERFCGPLISEERALQDSLSAFKGSSAVAVSERASARSFVYSQHYWPENNHALPEDTLKFALKPNTPNPEDEQSAGQKAHPSASKDQIVFEYSKRHTYVDITVMENGREKNITVPMVYLEYFTEGFQNTAFELQDTIREFWRGLQLDCSVQG